MEFEVKETDLLGRIGSIRTGGRSIETPCLLPVVHPVRQAVPASTIASLGFEGMMTNSHIIATRRRDDAIKDGVHSLIGFDGVVMTDSGGYQVLEYGEMELDYHDVANFQTKIGSDFAVTLDRPTGYPQTRAAAKNTVEYSLGSAVATLKDFPHGGTTWVGPVQGGLHLDLVRRSARTLVQAGFEFLALGSPVQIMQNYMFADLVKMIAATRRAIPYSMPLHLFGAGHPLTMALAISLGCDTFDSASYILFARNGRYMGRRGVTTLSSMKYLPCSCQVCASSTVRGLLELPESERVRLLAVHNLIVLREEVEACKEAIAEGRLWDLVEERSMLHPRLREAFFELTRHAGLLSDGTPAIKDRGLFVRSDEDYGRPEITSARRRAAQAIQRNSGSAVVVFAEARALRSGKGSNPDVYRVHPVLGLFPAELDSVYPFGQVVGPEGKRTPGAERTAFRELRRAGYSRVLTGHRGRRPRSKRSRRGASPSPPSSSARPQSPRRL